MNRRDKLLMILTVGVGILFGIGLYNTYMAHQDYQYYMENELFIESTIEINSIEISSNSVTIVGTLLDDDQQEFEFLLVGDDYSYLQSLQEGEIITVAADDEVEVERIYKIIAVRQSDVIYVDEITGYDNLLDALQLTRNGYLGYTVSVGVVWLGFIGLRLYFARKKTQ